MVEQSRADTAAEVPGKRRRVQLFGRFRLIDANGADAAGLGNADRALLAYLALSRRPHRRAKLAALLWPNRSEALHSLSESLRSLRKALGDKDGSILVPKSDPVVCRFDALEVDALLFEALISEGTPEALTQAAELYGDDLLDGIDSRSDEFERWLMAERERLRGLAVDGLGRLLRLRVDSGDCKSALATADRILALDPLCEEAHCAIVNIFLQTDQRAAARRHAQSCQALFQRENIDVTAETRRAFHEALRPAGSGRAADRGHAVARKLAAILSADVVGYSRLVHHDEAGAFERFRVLLRELLEPEIANYRGAIFKVMGDGLLAEFDSVVDAVECAVALQRKLHTLSADLPADARIDMRMGVNLGDVIMEGKDRHGEGVIIATRLQEFAPPCGVCVSRTVYNDVRHKLALVFVDLGERHLKNVAEPVSVYSVRLDEASPQPSSPILRFGLRIRLGRIRLSILLSLGIALALALCWLGYYHWRYWSVPWLAPDPFDKTIVWMKSRLPGEAPLRIAVLRFGARDADPEAETLAQGLSEDITTALGKVSEMFVINAASVLPYGPNPSDLRVVAQDLGVRYLLLGSVQQSGDQLQVQAELVDANEGHQVWGDSHAGQTGNVFDLQRRITLEVITEVQVKLTDGDMERITAIHGTKILDAWLAAGEGLKLMRHLTQEDNNRSRALYEKAKALDPGYAGAYEGLAWTYLLEAEFGWSRSAAQSLGEAQTWTQRALDLDPQKGRLYSLRGHLNLLLRNFNQAVTAGEFGAEKEPNDADAAALLALTLTYTGEPKRAIAVMNRAIELSPRYPAWYGWALGRAQRLTGDPNEAIQTLEGSLSERPASIVPLVELLIAYGEAGDSAKAKAAATAILAKVPTFSVRAWAAARPYKDPSMTDHDAAELRAAGLPD